MMHRMFRVVHSTRPILNNLNSKFSILNRIFGKKSKLDSMDPTKPNLDKIHEPKKDKKPQEQQAQQFDLEGIHRNLARDVDYAKLKEDKSKNIPEDVGKGGIDEVVFWSEGVVNMNQIMKLLKAYNTVFKRDNPQHPKSYHFLQFKRRVINNAFLCKDMSQLSIMSQFGRYLDIPQPQFWQRLQDKFYKLASAKQFEGELPLAINVLSNFAVRKKGDEIYHRMLQIIIMQIDAVDVDEAAKALLAFFRVRKGDEESILKLTNKIFERIGEARKETVAIMVPIMRQVSGVNRESFQRMEQVIIKAPWVGQLTVKQICAIARGFGHELGSDDLWKLLQQALKKHKLTDPEYINNLIYGFLSSYRCSKQLISTHILPFLKSHLESIHPKQLSQISKDLYIFQLDDKQNKQLCLTIEGLIIEYLRDLRQVQPRDLLPIAKNYCLTRSGTRDIYKMLEVVITEKFEEIKMDRFAFEGLLVVYENSDLCSAEMMQMFKNQV